MAETSTTEAQRPARRWSDALHVYREPASLRMFFLGFSAGLPLLLVLGTLSFRLREAGIDRTTIGYLSWVGLAYGFKWAWAPLVDRLPLPWLTAAFGRRRGWLLLAQAGVIAGLAGMAVADPQAGLNSVIGFALLVAFSSATQDIALDAYRIESARVEKQAALAAMYQTGYRIAMIWAGAGVQGGRVIGESDPRGEHPASEPITPAMVGQVVISGLLAGSIYAMVALGLGLIFGVMRVLNVAHGPLLMMGLWQQHRARFGPCDSIR